MPNLDVTQRLVGGTLVVLWVGVDGRPREAFTDISLASMTQSRCSVNTSDEHLDHSEEERGLPTSSLPLHFALRDT